MLKEIIFNPVMVLLVYPALILTIAAKVAVFVDKRFADKRKERK